MITGEREKKRHRLLKAAVLPLVVFMTLICWMLDVLETLDRWVIRPLAFLILLGGTVMMLQAQEDWRFYLPAFAVGAGLMFLAPAAHTFSDWIDTMKKKLIRAVY